VEENHTATVVVVGFVSRCRLHMEQRELDAQMEDDCWMGRLDLGPSSRWLEWRRGGVSLQWCLYWHQRRHPMATAKADFDFEAVAGSSQWEFREMSISGVAHGKCPTVVGDSYWNIEDSH
jgi:hypothetical protein